MNATCCFLWGAFQKGKGQKRRRSRLSKFVNSIARRFYIQERCPFRHSGPSWWQRIWEGQWKTHTCSCYVPSFPEFAYEGSPPPPAEEPFKTALHLKSPPRVFICRVHLSTDKICCWPDALTTRGRTVGHGVVPELISHVSCSARMQGLKDTRESWTEGMLGSASGRKTLLMAGSLCSRHDRWYLPSLLSVFYRTVRVVWRIDASGHLLL